MAFVVDAEGLPVCAVGEHVIDGPRDGTDFCPCPESILPVNRKFVVYSGATGVEKGQAAGSAGTQHGVREVHDRRCERRKSVVVVIGGLSITCVATARL